MSFWDVARAVGQVIEEEGNKALDKHDREMKAIIRKKSDAEIERAYRIRYDNPKISRRGIAIIEEEAARRGIS